MSASESFDPRPQGLLEARLVAKESGRDIVRVEGKLGFLLGYDDYVLAEGFGEAKLVIDIHALESHVGDNKRGSLCSVDDTLIDPARASILIGPTSLELIACAQTRSIVC